MNQAVSQRMSYANSRSPLMERDLAEAPVRTQGELEAGVCELVSRLVQEHMGRGPKNIQTHLIGDLLLVRLQGVLTAQEQQLAKSAASERGRDLLKQLRTHLIESARPRLEEIVHTLTGSRVVSLHHDISTVAGEEMVLFTLSAPPCCKPKSR